MCRHLVHLGAPVALDDLLYGPDHSLEVQSYAPALKEAGASTVVLAGYPGDKEDDYRSAGVDRFIFIRCDVVATLSELLADAGVLA